MHEFTAADQRYVYLVPSAGVFKLDAVSTAVLDTLGDRVLTPDQLVDTLSERYGRDDVRATVGELHAVHAIDDALAMDDAQPIQMPPDGFPLTTMVMNVTSKCNLACTYCYEYGDDRIVDDSCGTQPDYMSEETARASVDFMFREAGTNEVVHLNFFGGETLMNFAVLQSSVAYARERAQALGKQVLFGLTTNATLLKPHIIDWLAENQVGVTVSIDGPQEAQDEFRVFKNGRGSYDVVVPKIKELLQKHRSRPIGARVTLTKQNLNVKKIFRHLTEDLGFWEVGFAPVTTSTFQDYAIEDEGFDTMLSQFTDLAYEFLEDTVANKHHAFSNVRDTIEEIHKGVSKAFPCGAGLGLVGIGTDGDVALCHRFAGSEDHKMGSVADGIDRELQRAFLERHHIDNKPECHTCFARPLCAGGCYHEAQTRYGSTTNANLHYCTWIRTWTETCLEVYGALAERNPRYLSQFEH
jgi:uncharacterized protein